jgi:hypothetical protein
MTLVGRVLTVECPCAGTPHNEDTVTFRNVLPLAGGVAGIAAMVAAASELGDGFNNIVLAGYVFPVYLAHGIESWTFVDANGEPVPVADGDKVLPFGVKYEIADAADDLFGGEISGPLVKMIERSSADGRTARKTSQNRSSGRSRRPRSGPSSPSASADTEPLTA